MHLGGIQTEPSHYQNQEEDLLRAWLSQSDGGQPDGDSVRSMGEIYLGA